MLTKRDRLILELVGRYKVMSRGAIQRFALSGLKPASAFRKTNQRLRELTVKQKRLNRCRWGINSNSFVYFVGKRPDHWEHYAWVNDVAAVFKDELYYYKHEYVLDEIRADGLFILKTGRKFFLEVDLSGNPFDKPQKYSEVYTKPAINEAKQRIWHQNEWASFQRDRPVFPRIVVITYRPKTVTELIKEHSNKSLWWRVFSLEDKLADIKKEVLA